MKIQNEMQSYLKIWQEEALEVIAED